ncbi:MAG: hypothetical protein KDI55_20525, partial [Anaerolineae bacterium]|nr:hypothetical protein [Anaerolineae bacterium]
MSNGLAPQVRLQSEQGIGIGALLWSQGWSIDHLAIDQPATSVTFESGVLGWHLPVLPDFMKDHTLTASDDPGKLSEVLRRTVDISRNLWKWQNCAFSLRMRSRPQSGLIDLAILLRVRGRIGTARTLIDAVGHDLTAQMMQIGFEPLSLEGAGLQGFLNPFGRCQIIELRQHEELARLS